MSKPHTHTVKTACQYCGVGCGMQLHVAQNRVVKVSGDPTHPANFGRLCTKGLTCAEVLTAPGRLDAAFVRSGRTHALSRTDLDEAVTLTAQRLRAIIDQHGPDALAFYVSGQISLEAQYLANKLSKGFIRTNNIDSNSRLCMSSAASGYKQSLGADGPPGSYQDIEQSHCFLVIGSNMADCHPILFLRILDRCKKVGAKLIVVDPRRTSTAEKADLYLPIKPGTDLALLNGLLHLLLKNNHIDPEFIAHHTEGWEALLPLLEEYPPQHVAALTGLAEADLRQAAQWIGMAPEWMSLWTMGLNQSTHGVWHTNALCNLHLATGKICRPGSGPFSLTGQPNAMGGREVGYLSHGLPGQRTVLSQADRHFTEELWGLPQGSIKSQPGWDAVSLFRKLAEGEVKGIWIIGTNPVASLPNRQQVIEGLRKAELVITQDVFLETETNCYADIVLPGALWAEAEGVMVNSERNLTLMEKAVDPPGQALPDWQLITRIARAMGYEEGFPYESASEVFDEIRQAWNPQTGYDLRGVSYARLRREPVQWPCPPKAAAQNPIRYRGSRNSATLRFPTASGKAQFLARPYATPAELPDHTYSLILNTGRLPHQWHTLTKTGKIPTLNKLNPSPFLELHPKDAAVLNITDGDKIQVSSRRGKAEYPALVTDRVQSGTCFAPMHWNDLFGEHLAVNAVTNDALDPVSLQPELKFCAVAIEKVLSKETTTVDLTGDAFPFAASSSPPPHLSRIEAVRTLLGLQDPLPFQFQPEEKKYLSGFLTGVQLQTEYPTGRTPVLPETAPLSAERRVWLNGLLAGIFSRNGVPVSAPLAQPYVPVNIVPTVTLLYASQTGNAESIAAQLARRLSETHQHVRLFCMSDYPIAELPNERLLFIVTSTYGDGDMPDNARAFWVGLHSETTPLLSHLRYAVFALGNSAYDQFCQCGKNFDARFTKLGAHALLPRIDCDTDFQDAADQWIENIVGALTKETTHKNGAAGIMTQVTRRQTSTPFAPLPVYTKTHPFPARLLTNRCLNGVGAAKETRHYELLLEGSHLHYEAGGALGVWPTNCPALVEEILSRLSLDGDETVTVKEVGDLSLREALLRHYEIACISSRTLQIVAERSGDPLLKQILTGDKKTERQRFLWEKQFADLLHDYPKVRLSAAELISVLGRLQPRLYSLASSPKAHPGEAHLTVRTIRYEYAGRMRKGAASTFLADRADAGPVPVFLQKSLHFHLPADATAPIIMIGPGTGVAPFRGFLHERALTGATGRNWLFFGEQHAASDFYYRDEFTDWQHSGVLTHLNVAFSRDQPEKIYVQHRLLEHGAEVWAWLQEGASIYVCGDARHMAKDVDITLHLVARQHGNLSADNAVAYVQQLTREKRYLRDVY